MERALRLDDPTQYESSTPIHQDGSCNGLQHYAALGGDLEGASAVNLVPADRPDDIYTRISKKVQTLVDADIESVEEAKLMARRINRKLVKQTVMTNTYGVTFMGAKAQILSRLEEAGEGEVGGLTEEQMKKCAGYITKKVFLCMDHMFEGAREIQTWLTTAAKLVSQSIPVERINPLEIAFYDALVNEGLIGEQKIEKVEKEDSLLGAALMDKVSESSKTEEDDDEYFEDIEFVKVHKKDCPTRMTSMTWTTPLGFPIIQPYRNASVASVKTFMQTFSVIDDTKTGPVNSLKQASAFPPNFVHSLDACHMLLTANACQSHGMTFAAVHDSYWTHACDIDKMSEVLRDCFIRLHSQNIMQRLDEELRARFAQHRLWREISISKEEAVLFKKVGDKVGYVFRGKKYAKLWVPFELGPLPKKGAFDIQQVRDSTYFFH